MVDPLRFAEVRWGLTKLVKIDESLALTEREVNIIKHEEFIVDASRLSDQLWLVYLVEEQQSGGHTDANARNGDPEVLVKLLLDIAKAEEADRRHVYPGSICTGVPVIDQLISVSLVVGDRIHD